MLNSLHSASQSHRLPRSIRVASLVGLLLILIMGAIAQSAGADCGETDPATLLPGDDQCAGWVRDGDPQTAYTEEELYEIINGAASLYLNYGFVSAAFQNYLGQLGEDQVPATLSLFNQGLTENAEALYNDPNSGMGDPVTSWPFDGEARYRVQFGVTTFQFQEACFFGSIQVISDQEEALTGARCLAEYICTLIQGCVPVEVRSWGKIKTSFP